MKPKKLIVGDELVQRMEATCDWCGQEKECFQCTRPIKEYYSAAINGDVVRTIKDYHFERVGGGLFSSGKSVRVIDGDTNIHFLYEKEEKTLEVNSHICADCAKQLGNS